MEHAAWSRTCCLLVVYITGTMRRYRIKDFRIKSQKKKSPHTRRGPPMPEERSAPAPAVPATTTRAGRRLPRRQARIATTTRARLARAIARRRTTAHCPAPSSQTVPQAQPHFSLHSMGAKAAPARSSRRLQPARPPASRDAARSSVRGTVSRMSMQKSTRPAACAHVWPVAGRSGGVRPASGDRGQHALTTGPASGSARRRSSSSREWNAAHAMCFAMLCYVLLCMCIRNGLCPSTPDSTPPERAPP